MNMDFLLLYIREDGLFARLLHGEQDRETFREAVREEVSEDSIRRVFRTLVARFEKKLILEGLRLTVAYSLSRKVEVLRPCVAEMLREYPFVDSCSLLRRDELFYRAACVLSAERPRQVLYCDTRETRLFTADGEFPLSSERVSGNGFIDWLLGFVETEGDSPEYFHSQLERMTELCRVYRCFSPATNGPRPLNTEIFPKRSEHPNLAARPKRSGRSASSENDGFLMRIRRRSSDSAPCESIERIDYTALSPIDRAKVDRKYPALYRSTRDKRGNYCRISLGEAASAFETLFGNIRSAMLTELIVVGHYADFPLTVDFLNALPQKPSISYDSESKLLLDGMEQAVSDRICSSRLSLRDIDGEEIVLWDAEDPSENRPREKRVCFPVTLKRSISREEWRKKTPQMPYFLTLEELKCDRDGSFTRLRVEKSGDLKEFCYKRQKDGSYRLRIPDDTGEPQSAFRTVLLGIGATPVGVCCHISASGNEW